MEVCFIILLNSYLRATIYFYSGKGNTTTNHPDLEPFTIFKKRIYLSLLSFNVTYTKIQYKLCFFDQNMYPVYG